ncbi:tetratricopeptide repeat protein [Sulfuriferula multivorans]|nr:tetratricopeptide repeat protein [Sulfuriferula multivorans]
MNKGCPECGSARLRGSSIRTGDTLVQRLVCTPLRCRECRSRFWIYSPVKIVLLSVLLLGMAFWLVRDQLHPAPISATSDLAAADKQFARLSAQALKGDAEAQLRLGKMYANGEGVIVDVTKAAQWFDKAAHQGNAEAQFLYASALLDGRGVVQDYQAALKWIEMPARRGNPQAQYRLGQMYRFGIGTPVDKVKAYMWFNLAAAQGMDEAARARESVVGQLKPEEIARAQADAHQINEQMLPKTDAAKNATTSPPASP